MGRVLGVRLLSSLGVGFVAGRVVAGDRRLTDDEADPELGQARAGLDHDVSMVLAQEPAGDVQTETRALSGRLGGEERVEDELELM